ncbi:hypothetical protein GCM10007036_21160 [Alsobacter metallidurans]|uniref:Uncharacterized protein n=1 Tax=Alsobacter metallidurans TaxID=340221 RepID=A0A917I6Q7_9HYPH|nr:hypothetical protein GCM10007036_21160 [Alsobacter metallidurans]
MPLRAPRNVPGDVPVEGAACRIGLTPDEFAGNTLSASNALFETYAPADVTSLADVADARRRGRNKLRDGNE